MSKIINRMRWLSAGVYLGIAFVIWIKGEELNETKKKSDPYNFNNYKHNYQKAETNA
jgi:hypothetical protein